MSLQKHRHIQRKTVYLPIPAFPKISAMISSCAPSSGYQHRNPVALSSKAALGKPEYPFQHTPRYRESLVGNGKTMGPFAAGIHVPAFHTPRNLHPHGQDSPQYAVYLRIDGNAVNQGKGTPFGNHLADFPFGLKDSVTGGTEQPLNRKSADISGYARIRYGASRCYDPA
jgi:hypothetical protein